MFRDVFVKDMAMDEYHAHHAYNMSLLNEVIDYSVLHMVHKKNSPQKETDALRLGKLIHTAILEPEKYNPLVLPSGDRRTVKWKQEVTEKFSLTTPALKDPVEELKELYPSSVIITQEDDAIITGMKNAVYSEESVACMFKKKTWTERCVFATHEETGLPVKIRPDFYTESYTGVFIDLKSTEDASESGFQGSIYKYRYYRSIAFYTDILRSTGLKFGAYRLLAVEKSAPHGISLWSLGDDLYLRGRKDYSNALRQVAEYEKTKIAKGYRNLDGKISFECI